MALKPSYSGNASLGIKIAGSSKLCPSQYEKSVFTEMYA
jgi:hypothetical protein